MKQQHENTDNPEQGLKSKTQIKKEFKALQELGKQLVDLSPSQLKQLPLSESMLALLTTAKTLERGNFNRQVRLIGSHMVDEDVDAIQIALKKLKHPQQQAVARLHQIEQWRDSLLQGDPELFAELAQTYGGFEHQYVNQLIRNARKEVQQNKEPKSARLLFQYLQKLELNNTEN